MPTPAVQAVLDSITEAHRLNLEATGRELALRCDLGDKGYYQLLQDEWQAQEHEAAQEADRD